MASTDRMLGQRDSLNEVVDLDQALMEVILVFHDHNADM
jgi:hypothetical protein